MPTDLANAAALKTALSAVPQNAGIEFVEVPLKVRGGKIYYATENQDARACGAVSANLPLSVIVDAVKESGFKPAAEISAFYDNQLPTKYPAAGYTTIDDGSQWVDNDPEHGGVPWTAPDSEEVGDVHGTPPCLGSLSTHCEPSSTVTYPAEGRCVGS